MTDETEFIKRLQNPLSKEAAFRELLHLYKERLYWHIRKIVINHEDADDALQNTFIKVHRGIDKFKGESQLFSWLYRIATNESITLLNKNAKRLQISNEEHQIRAINNLSADVYFEGDAIQLKLQKAISTLPQKQQLVFNMRYFDDLKYKTMAEILETSEGALKASYHIAAKKIEDFLTSD